MLLPIRVHKRFLTLFKTLQIDDCPQQSTLNIHVLNIESNEFIYCKLVEELRDIIITYVHSNRRLEEFRRVILRIALNLFSKQYKNFAIIRQTKVS